MNCGMSITGVSLWNKKKRAIGTWNNTGSSVLDLKCSMINERNQIQRLHTIWVYLYDIPKKGDSRDIKWVSVCQGLGVGTISVPWSMREFLRVLEFLKSRLWWWLQEYKELPELIELFTRKSALYCM